MPVTFPTKGQTVKMTIADSPSADAFARLRVSEPHTIFDSKQIFDNAPLFWDDQEVSGSGTSSTHSVNKASSLLGVSALTAGRRMRQTFMRFNYQPAKSQLVFMTGTLGITGGGAGIKRSMGIYDDDNGIFFRDNEGVVEVVIRSKTTGSVIEDAQPQLNWNLDKMDGAGKSGITLDGSKSQIIIIDFEWLSVGRVRMGFVMDGIPVYVHEFLHANTLEGAYMSTPNLPLRYEITNDGTGVASDLEAICSSVISEGGIQNNGALHYHSTEGVHIRANAVGTKYMVAGVRLKTTHLGATVRFAGISMLNESNDDFEWFLVLNPIVVGSPVWSDQLSSAAQTTIGEASNPSATTVTGGVNLVGGFVKSGGSSGDVTLGVDNAILLGSKIDGTRDEIYLIVQPMTTNADIHGGFTWRELS